MANETEKIGVIGAGTMGAGIAQVAAQTGFETLIYDVNQELIEAGLCRVANFLRGSRERGKISAEEEHAVLNRLRGTTKLADLTIPAWLSKRRQKNWNSSAISSNSSMRSVVPRRSWRPTPPRSP